MALVTQPVDAGQDSGCVTSATQHQLELLRSDSTDARTRADALRFVIHFVGDMHQPLHDVTNNDLGGNCVPVNSLATSRWRETRRRNPTRPISMRC